MRHVLWLDGVYGWEPGRTPVFAEQREVTDADVQQLVSRIRERVARALRKAGKWVAPGEAADGVEGGGDELLPGLAAAAVPRCHVDRLRGRRVHAIVA